MQAQPPLTFPMCTTELLSTEYQYQNDNNNINIDQESKVWYCYFIIGGNYVSKN